MVIGVDIEPLQNAHRMRGIGSVVRNFINHLPAEAQRHQFVFFAQPISKDGREALAGLNLEGLDYQLRFYGPRHLINRRLPGKLNLMISGINRLYKLHDMRFGDSRLKPGDLADIDCFLQVDPAVPLPRRRSMKTVLFVHDLIPYVLEWDYLWNYRTARRHGFSRKAALRVQVRRSLFRQEYRLAVKRADLLIANSKCTRQDFMRYLQVPARKITVAHLGIDPRPAKEAPARIPTKYYRSTSWGYLPFDFTFPESTPFLLFVGGADRRRKLIDVVTAFNQLRGRGVDIKLVLAGDTMRGPMDIATEETQAALKNSSYNDDIIFLGYVDEATLRWLYSHATAYIFPSTYEGFGLPVLEAMNLSCPVISYRNAATVEVAGDTPLYTSNAEELMNAIQHILSHAHDMPKLIAQGHKQADSFSWQQTAATILNRLTE